MGETLMLRIKTMPIRIYSLHRYPLKGGRGVDALSLRIDADGLVVDDRSLMLVEPGSGSFLSQRQLPAMARIAVNGRSISFDQQSIDLPMAEGTVCRVDVWGDVFDAIDLGDAVAATLSAWLGKPVRLVRLPERSGRVIDPFWTRGHAVRSSFADLAPILVVGRASLEELNRRREQAGFEAVPMARFRPNIVVDGVAPFEEDRIPRLRHASGAMIELVKPCARCKVTEIDQTTGMVMKDEVLSTLAGFRSFANARDKQGVMFGQNAFVVHQGPIEMRIGDVLEPA
jgi:uncharacterized protein